MTRTYEMVSDEQVFNSIAHFHRFPPKGVDGGADGMTGEIRIIEKDGREITAPQRSAGARSPSKFTGIEVLRGESVVVRLPGGAGWGPPRDRGRDAIAHDLRDDLISLKAAVEIYGLDPADAEGIVSRYSWEHKRRTYRSAGTVPPGEATAASDS